jgi:hypothetical protein
MGPLQAESLLWGPAADTRKFVGGIDVGKGGQLRDCAAEYVLGVYALHHRLSVLTIFDPRLQTHVRAE